MKDCTRCTNYKEVKSFKEIALDVLVRSIAFMIGVFLILWLLPY